MQDSPHYDVHMYLVDRSELDNVCSESNLENVLPETLIKELIQKGIPVPGVGAANRSASQSSTPLPTTVLQFLQID